MSAYQEIKDTLDSPGMKLIVRALRAHHKAVYRQYRNCGSMEQLLNLQTVQKVIDTTIPQVLEQLLNAHVEQPKNGPKKQEWFFDQWVKCSAWWAKNIAAKFRGAVVPVKIS